MPQPWTCAGLAEPAACPGLCVSAVHHPFRSTPFIGRKAEGLMGAVMLESDRGAGWEAHLGTLPVLSVLILTLANI